MTARAGGERPEAHEKCTSEKWGIRCWLVKGHSVAHVARGCSWGVSMADEEPEPQAREGERHRAAPADTHAAYDAMMADRDRWRVEAKRLRAELEAGQRRVRDLEAAIRSACVLLTEGGGDE